MQFPGLMSTPGSFSVLQMPPVAVSHYISVVRINGGRATARGLKTCYFIISRFNRLPPASLHFVKKTPCANDIYRNAG